MRTENKTSLQVGKIADNSFYFYIADLQGISAFSADSL